MYKIIIITLFFYGTFIMADEPITPLPQSVKVNQAKAKLGQALYFDPILSHNDTVSCATCHNLQNGGDEGLKFSIGIYGRKEPVNVPTVYNAVFNFRQFWDGRAKDLQEQAAGPIANPLEMGSSFKEAIEKLKKSKYKKLFDAIYPDGITKKNITDAIAEYEKTLITPNSRFDKYLRGNKNALTKNEKEGYELFKSKGCISCHNGINIGGNLYNKFGIYKKAGSKWLGRYNVTHRERDKHFFKVPSLRNVARTAPYFHDGRTYSLNKAVEIMSQYQLGRHITKEQIAKIVAFLKSLNGELPKDIEPPR